MTVDKSIDSRFIPLEGLRPMVAATLDVLRRIEDEGLEGRCLLFRSA